MYIYTREADLVLSLGSSLQIMPVADFPLLGIENNAKFVIINGQKTRHDDFADLILRYR